MKLKERLTERARESKVFKYLPFLSLIVMELLALSLLYFQRPGCHLKEMPELSSAAPLRKSCHVAMSSILNKKAHPMLFDESLVTQMERDDYKFFDFLGSTLR